MADFIVRLLNNGMECYGFSCPESLGNYFTFGKGGLHSLTETCVYDELYKLNIKAYSERYHNSDADAADMVYPEYREVSLWKPLHYAAGKDGRARPAVPESYYRLRKHLKFWLYQCDEDSTRESELYKGMQMLSNRLTDFIVENAEAYYNLPWE